MTLALLAALTVTVGAGERAFDTAALAALPQAEATATFHGAATRCTGPRLDTVLAAAGAPAGAALRGEALMDVAVATGADGYRAAFAISGIDPQLGDDKVIVALRCDGAASAALRLLADGDRRGARSVRDLVRVDVRRLER